ncbi:unnamed protein product [Rotaria socialis]
MACYEAVVFIFRLAWLFMTFKNCLINIAIDLKVDDKFERINNIFFFEDNTFIVIKQTIRHTELGKSQAKLSQKSFQMKFNQVESSLT